MSLFQKSVENKYLSELDSVLIDKKYKEFQDYFGNPSIQENIRNSKEEQFQEGFLRELFVSIFGYTLNPQPNFNLTTELKNIANSKKADGAILKGEDAIAVIELKGTDTTDLDKIETQAFGYKNHHPKCVYVITSNFEKLRFYIQNAVDHIDFDLFNLTRKEFSLMWLCLAKDNLLNGLPQKIKESSLLQEENITKKLYADYSKFREAIYNNLVKNNPETDKLLLFKKTQKLLDRFLFIFFAEDRLLLPPNSISEIVKQWTTLKEELDEYVPLYDRFKKYFGYMNTGYKGKKYDIYAYNGGLFAPDEILDNISIDDEILYKHTLTLSQYDFETDVDVNILGHIFEHSLGEIENVQAEIKGEKIDTQKTKRKKDGIFYTPKYITKYIVENTVGKLCEEKRNELDIVDEEYAKGRKNRKKDTIKTLDNKLTDYRNWLLNLTILDPACGSGAFLNQALDFLITEHRKIDDLRAQLFGSGLVFSDITTDILEKNIYGVDLNEESVEIAKLSLWLRTAQKGRKLNKLNNNIKCGNSLIDDPEIAGEKAFNWQNEFPEIFAKGGFDVVIGNPPYVNINTMPEIHEFLKNKYTEIHTGYNDLMYYFLFKGIDILKTSGLYGVITSNYFIGNDYADKLRLFLNKHVETIVNFEKTLVFEDANVHTTLVFAKKETHNKLMQFYTYTANNPLRMVDLSLGYTFCELERNKQSNKWLIANNNNQRIIDKLHIDSKVIGEVCEIAKGSESGKNEIFTISLELANKYNIEKNVLRKCVKNSDILRYFLNEKDSYLIYSDNNFSKTLFPNTYKYLELHKDALLDRRGPKTNEYEWWRLHRPSIKEIFDAKEKLLVPYRANSNRFAYDNQQFFNNGGDIRCLVLKNNAQFSIKYILALLNSKLLDWFYGFIGKSKGNAREYFNKPLSEIPIKNIPLKDQESFIQLADSMLKYKKELNQKSNRFIKRLSDNFNIDKINSGIENFANNDFKMLLKELSKLKIQLSLSQQDEWEEYFNSYKSEINQLQSEIEKTDNEIDRMVFELYGLTEEEIKILEDSL